MDKVREQSVYHGPRGMDNLSVSEKPAKSGPEIKPIYEVLEDFASDTTFHGIRYTTDGHSHYLIRRFIWLCLFLLSLAVFLLLLSKKVQHYRSHPKNINLDVVYSQTLPFPAVTICNQNPTRLTALQKHGLYDIIVHDGGDGGNDDDVNDYEEAYDSVITPGEPTSQCNSFQLYEGITEIPEKLLKKSFLIRETTREVCREMCKGLYNDSCSGFLYNRTGKSCTITPYTGEWLASELNNSKSNQRVEFYRRKRCLESSYIYCDFEDEKCPLVSEISDVSTEQWQETNASDASMAADNTLNLDYGNFLQLPVSSVRSGLIARAQTDYINTTGLCIEFFYWVEATDDQPIISVVIINEEKEEIVIRDDNQISLPGWRYFLYNFSSLATSINKVAIQGTRPIRGSNGLAVDDVMLQNCGKFDAEVQCKTTAVGSGYRGNKAESIFGEDCSLWTEINNDIVGKLSVVDTRSIKNHCINILGGNPWPGPSCLIQDNRGRYNLRECEIPYCPCRRPDAYRCSSGLCLPKSFKCNGRAECPDSDDEGKVCDYQRNITCNFSEAFLCGYKSSIVTAMRWSKKSDLYDSLLSIPQYKFNSETAGDTGDAMVISAAAGLLGDISRLTSPLGVFDKPTTVSFLYYLPRNNSDPAASLEVMIVDSFGLLIHKKTLTSTWNDRIGDGTWKAEKLCVPSGTYAVQFLATHGVPYLTDMAIADVVVNASQPCQYVADPSPAFKKSVNCTFQRSLCGYSVEKSGSRLVYSFVYKQPATDPRTCGNFTTTEGFIASPGYPDPYTSMLDCRQQIFAPPGSVISVTFIQFRVESSVNCLNDSLQISYKTDAATFQSQRPLCGTDLPSTITLKTDHVILNFVTDSSVSDMGYNISYVILLPRDMDLTLSIASTSSSSHVMKMTSPVFLTNGESCLRTSFSANSYFAIHVIQAQDGILNTTTVLISIQPVKLSQIRIPLPAFEGLDKSIAIQFESRTDQPGTSVEINYIEILLQKCNNENTGTLTSPICNSFNDDSFCGYRSGSTFNRSLSWIPVLENDDTGVMRAEFGNGPSDELSILASPIFNSNILTQSNRCLQVLYRMYPTDTLNFTVYISSEDAEEIWSSSWSQSMSDPSGYAANDNEALQKISIKLDPDLSDLEVYLFFFAVHYSYVDCAYGCSVTLYNVTFQNCPDYTPENNVNCTFSTFDDVSTCGYTYFDDTRWSVSSFSAEDNMDADSLFDSPFKLFFRSQSSLPAYDYSNILLTPLINSTSPSLLKIKLKYSTEAGSVAFFDVHETSQLDYPTRRIESFQLNGGSTTLKICLPAGVYKLAFALVTAEGNISIFEISQTNERCSFASPPIENCPTEDLCLDRVRSVFGAALWSYAQNSASYINSTNRSVHIRNDLEGRISLSHTRNTLLYIRSTSRPTMMIDLVFNVSSCTYSPQSICSDPKQKIKIFTTNEDGSTNFISYQLTYRLDYNNYKQRGPYPLPFTMDSYLLNFTNITTYNGIVYVDMTAEAVNISSGLMYRVREPESLKDYILQLGASNLVQYISASDSTGVMDYRSDEESNYQSSFSQSLQFLSVSPIFSTVGVWYSNVYTFQPLGSEPVILCASLALTYKNILRATLISRSRNIGNRTDSTVRHSILDYIWLDSTTVEEIRGEFEVVLPVGSDSYQVQIVLTMSDGSMIRNVSLIQSRCNQADIHVAEEGLWCNFTNFDRCGFVDKSGLNSDTHWILSTIDAANSDDFIKDCTGPDHGLLYLGKRNVTISGRKCQPWNESYPNYHPYLDVQIFPDYELLGVWDINDIRNYCRNPMMGSSAEAAPWCYTTDEAVNMEYCDIPKCTEYSLKATFGRAVGLAVLESTIFKVTGSTEACLTFSYNISSPKINLNVYFSNPSRSRNDSLVVLQYWSQMELSNWITVPLKVDSDGTKLIIVADKIGVSLDRQWVSIDSLRLVPGPCPNQTLKDQQEVNDSRIKYQGKRLSEKAYKKIIYSEYQNFTKRDFSKYLGSGRNQFIMKCQWNSTDCVEGSIVPEYTEMGLCYTFNGPTTPELLTIQEGEAKGLSLTLNIERYEYVPSLIDGIGAKIQLHDRNNIEAVLDLGFAVTPGLRTLTAISLSTSKVLPPPWGVCGATPLRQYDNSSKYTAARCYTECSLASLIYECNCSAEYMPGKNRVCNLEEQETCYNYWYATGSSDCSPCPVECEISTYDPSLSFSPLSLQAFQDVLDNSENLADEYQNALELKYRVHSDLFIKTVSLMTTALDTHKGLRLFLQLYIVNKATSFTTLVIESFNSLASMAFDDLSVATVGYLQEYIDCYSSTAQYFIDSLQQSLTTCSQLLSKIYSILYKFPNLNQEEIRLVEAFNSEISILLLYLDNIENAYESVLQELDDTDACQEKVTTLDCFKIMVSLRLTLFDYIHSNDSFYNINWHTSSSPTSASVELLTSSVTVQGDDVTTDYFQNDDNSAYVNETENIKKLQTIKNSLDLIRIYIRTTGDCVKQYPTYLDNAVEGFQLILENIVTPASLDIIQNSLFDLQVNEFEFKRSLEYYISGNNGAPVPLSSIIAQVRATISKIEVSIDNILANVLQIYLTELRQNIDNHASKLIAYYSIALASLDALSDEMGSKKSSVESFARSLKIWRKPEPRFQSEKKFEFKFSSEESKQIWPKDVQLNEFVQSNNYYRQINFIIESFCSNLKNILNILQSDILKPAQQSFTSSLQELKDHMQQFLDSNVINDNFVSQNLMKVDVYFGEMKFEKIEQVASYELTTLFSDMGGYLGLLLGASVLSLCEVFDLIIYHTILRTFCRKRGSNKISTTNSAGRDQTGF